MFQDQGAQAGLSILPKKDFDSGCLQRVASAGSGARGGLQSSEQHRGKALSSEDFVASDALVFERCYVFPGEIPAGREPAAALEALQSRMSRMVASGCPEAPGVTFFGAF